MEELKDTLKLKCGAKLDIKYIVKEDTGTVIAITCDDVSEEFRQFIQRKYTVLRLYGISRKHFNRFFMPCIFKGVAKLDPRDEWSKEKGMKIAKRKLRYKLNASANRRLKFMSSYIRRICDELEKTSLK